MKSVNNIKDTIFILTEAASGGVLAKRGVL